MTAGLPDSAAASGTPNSSTTNPETTGEDPYFPKHATWSSNSPVQPTPLVIASFEDGRAVVKNNVAKKVVLITCDEAPPSEAAPVPSPPTSDDTPAPPPSLDADAPAPPSLKAKANAAQDACATGVIIVNDDKEHPDEVRRQIPDDGTGTVSIPVLVVSYNKGMKFQKQIQNLASLEVELSPSGWCGTTEFWLFRLISIGTWIPICSL